MIQVYRGDGRYNIMANCIGARGIESEEADEDFSSARPPGPDQPMGQARRDCVTRVSLASERAG